MAVLTAAGKVLQADLQGDAVRALSGSMVAFQGQVAFSSAGAGGGDGLRAALKRKVAGESLALMECSGTGRVHLAVDAQDVTVVDLTGDTLVVESSAVLAVTPGLRLDVRFAGLGGAVAGQGLATTTATGTGQVALLSRGPLFGLTVSSGSPVVVDPDAFVASTGSATPTLVSGVTWRSVAAGGTGEAFSLRFTGSGLVLVQPAER